MQKLLKNPWIRKVLAPMLRLCWTSFEAMLVHLGAMLAHLGAILARLKAMLAHLGTRLSHLGAMLARLEAILAQHARRNARRRSKTQSKTKISQKKPKPHATEGSPRVPPRFLPGSSQVPPFPRGEVGGRGASLYNLRLLSNY